MRKLTRRHTLLLPLLALPIPAAAEPLALAPLMAQLAAIPERRARFTEERHFSALTQTLTSRGTLVYRRPDYLEMDKEWPVPERTVIDGTRLILTEAASNDPPRVLDFAGRPEVGTMFEAMRAPLAGDLSALQRVFDVDARGTLDAWTLTLVPRDPRAAKLMRNAHLVGHGSWIGEIRFVQANGDESRIMIAPI